MGNIQSDRKKKGARVSPWGRRTQKEQSLAFAETTGLPTVLDRILAEGDAVMFSRTSDGGAVLLTLMAGSDRHKVYCSGQEELDEALANLAEAYPEEGK